MKHFKTLLLTLPLVVMGLAGCTGNKTPSQSEPASNPSSEVAPSENSSEEQPPEHSSEGQPSQNSSEQQPSEGSSEGQPSENSSEQQPSETSSEEQPSEGSSGNTSEPTVKSVTVKFWHTFGQTVVDGLKEKIAAFKKLVKDHDGVDVEIEMAYQGGYDDIANQIRNGFSNDNVPTISVAYPDNVADYLEIGKSAGREFVVNLDSYIESDIVGFGLEDWLGDEYDEDDFVEEFFSEGSQYMVDGTYSLPYMKSTEIMYYNMELLIKVMKTYRPDFNSSETKIQQFMKNISWSDFMNLCAYIKDNMASISAELEYPFCYDSDANFFITKLYQEEIPYASVKDGKGVIEFGKEGNVERTTEFLESLNDAYGAGIITTKGKRGGYSSDLFTNERCIFSVGSSGGAGYNFPQADAFTLGVCRVPDSNNNPLYVTQGPTLAMFNSDSLSPEVNEATKLYAWKFMKYITNAQVNAELCVNGSEGYIPVRYSAFETELFMEFMEEGENYAKCYKVVVDDINADCGYLVSPAFKGSAFLRDRVGSLLTAALDCPKADIPAKIAEAVNDANMQL